MIRRIVIPPWVQRGIRSNQKMYVQHNVYGVDTETVNGKPYTLQISGPGVSLVKRISSRTITRAFLETVSSTPDGSVFYAHNLEFDLPVLFFPALDAFLDSHFVIETSGYRIEIFFHKVNYAQITKGKRLFHVIDTFAYFKTSLARLADVFDLPAKLQKPRKIGRVFYHGDEWRRFKAYGLRDAQTAKALGDKIDDFHRAYDVVQTISAPQLAARIFRHRFIPKGEKIPCPPRECQDAAILSYHGGKSGLYVKPGIYKGVSVYDINSAYPYAFTSLPLFLGCSYVQVRGWRSDYQGIVCFSGHDTGQPYSLIRTHDFKREHEYNGVWTTSYEFSAARRFGYLKNCKIHHGWRVDNGNSNCNPLADFARYFYDKKQAEKGALREFYKIVLNSLYGKFIQNVTETDTEWRWQDGKLQEPSRTYRAGGLWNPLLASLITGYVRAMLTDFEEKYHALHSSTDSIITQSRGVPTGRLLGMLSQKATGTALLLRAKLYVVWDAKREVQIFALHGFHGSLGQLIALLRKGTRTYAHRRMNKIRESKRSNLIPLTIQTFFKNIHLSGVDGPLPIPPLTFQGRKI